MPYTPEQLEKNARELESMIADRDEPILMEKPQQVVERLKQAARDARLRQGVEQLRDNVKAIDYQLAATLTALLAETETP